jgi:hypothetical protein
MTIEEFDRWWKDAKLCWPSLATWLHKAFPDQSQQSELLRKWFRAIDDVTLLDALEVNRQMQSGEMPWVGEYDSDKERLPRHVRGLAKQLAADRRPTENREQFAPTTHKAGGFPGAAIIRRMETLLKAGTPRAEARAMALEEFPVGTSPFPERRYHCAKCLDVGRISVASNAAIEAMLIGKFADCHHRVGTMRCECRGNRSTKPNYILATYDPAQDFKIEDFLWQEAEVSRFTEWVAWQREHRAGEMLKRRVNYEPGFASFNERSFAP